MDLSSVGNFLSSNSGTIGSLLGTGAQLYGQQNASEAITNASTAGIGQAQTYLGNINSLYAPQTTLGNSAMTALGSAEGLNGTAPDYSGFENMPGYQFAVQQGTQAIQRQAASMGSAYTPNTAQAVGQYVTGTAMQDYNNYISQLQQSAGLGAQANQTLAGANLQTAGNIEQLGMNSGMAQAGMYTGMGQTIAGAGTGGVNGSGTALGSIGSLLGSGLNMLGNSLGGSSSSSSSGYDPYAGFDTSSLGNLNYGLTTSSPSYSDVSGSSDLGSLDTSLSSDPYAATDFSGTDSSF
jgi:hypothetical protein